MKEKVICGLQQVGIGVKDANESWKWYRAHFGIDIPVVADEGVAERMLPYTGGKPQPRFAILAVSLQGGGGLEIWEPRGRELNYPAQRPRLGDLGIFIAKIKSRDVKATFEEFSRKGLRLLGEPTTFAGIRHFYMQDPWDNILEIVEDPYVMVPSKQFTTGGSFGAVLGVSEMDRSVAFYGKLLGYDKVLADETGVFKDMECLPGGSRKVRRVLLAHSKAFEGPLSELMGPSQLELVQALEEPVVKYMKTVTGAIRATSRSASTYGTWNRSVPIARRWAILSSATAAWISTWATPTAISPTLKTPTARSSSSSRPTKSRLRRSSASTST